MANVNRDRSASQGSSTECDGDEPHPRSRGGAHCRAPLEPSSVASDAVAAAQASTCEIRSAGASRVEPSQVVGDERIGPRCVADASCAAASAGVTQNVLQASGDRVPSALSEQTFERARLSDDSLAPVTERRGPRTDATTDRPVYARRLMQVSGQDATQVSIRDVSLCNGEGAAIAASIVQQLILEGAKVNRIYVNGARYDAQADESIRSRATHSTVVRPARTDDGSNKE